MLTDKKTLIITGGGKPIYKLYNQITSGLCTFWKYQIKKIKSHKTLLHIHSPRSALIY